MGMLFYTLLKIIIGPILIMKVVDLFCGAGGFSTVFEKYPDFEAVYAFDNDPKCIKLYEANHPHVETECCDAREALVHCHDIMCAGFPCQSFSVSGNRLGFDDEDRGWVFGYLCGLIKQHEPYIILLENVKHILHHDHGNTLDTIQFKLKSLGYYLHTIVLKASDHTTNPQSRERVFFLGFQDKILYDQFNPVFEKVSRHEKRPIGGYLVDAADKYYYTPKSKIYDELKRDVVKDDTLYQHRRCYVKQCEGCPTLMATMGTGGNNVPILKTADDRVRKLTPRECFNFQGYPSSYTLVGIERLCYI